MDENSVGANASRAAGQIAHIQTNLSTVSDEFALLAQRVDITFCIFCKLVNPISVPNFMT